MEGTPAVQASENLPLPSPGRNPVVDIHLLPRHEVATHPYPSSMPGAWTGNCFFKQNAGGPAYSIPERNCMRDAGTSQAESPRLFSGWF